MDRAGRRLFDQIRFAPLFGLASNAPAARFSAEGGWRPLGCLANHGFVPSFPVAFAGNVRALRSHPASVIRSSAGRCRACLEVRFRHRQTASDRCCAAAVQRPAPLQVLATLGEIGQIPRRSVRCARMRVALVCRCLRQLDGARITFPTAAEVGPAPPRDAPAAVLFCQLRCPSMPILSCSRWSRCSGPLLRHLAGKPKRLVFRAARFVAPLNRLGRGLPIWASLRTTGRDRSPSAQGRPTARSPSSTAALVLFFSHWCRVFVRGNHSNARSRIPVAW